MTGYRASRPGRHWRRHPIRIRFDTGGHFAAPETPDLLVDDIRTFFWTLRVVQG